MSFVNPDEVQRPAPPLVAPASWGTAVNSALQWLYGDSASTTVSTFLNGWSGIASYSRAGRLLVISASISGGTMGAPAFSVPFAVTTTRAVNSGAPGTPATMFVALSVGTVIPLAMSATFAWDLIVPII